VSPVAGRKAALLIATAEYGDPAFRRLRTPGHDVEALTRVLADPAIGGFDMHALVNQPGQLVEEEIEGFFADRKPDDLLLLYLSCHGVKDQDGRLYFAATDTKLQRLAATGISSTFVNQQMDNSRSRQIVLLLDCCYSGAFARGFATRGGEGVELKERFQGRGRVVITASSAMEYAFEAGQLTSEGGQPSVFTTAVVQGLQTGEADRDADGRVSVDELYDFVFDQVRQATPNQTPGIFFSDVQGTLYIAQNPNPRPLVERLALTLGPPQVQGGRTGRLVATASNDGTTTLDLALRARALEAGVEGGVEPDRLVLDPGTGAIADVRISPPRPLTGVARRHMVQVQATNSGGRRWQATAVFEQAPLLRRRQLLLGAGAAAVALLIVLLFMLFRGGVPRNSPLLSERGEIKTAGAENSYAFTARQGQQVFLDVQECPSRGNLHWTLRAPNEPTGFDEAFIRDEPLCLTSTAYDKGPFPLPQAGRYQLVVGGDEATGTYRFTLWSVPAQQFSVSIGDTIDPDHPGKGSGNIEVPGAQDHYAFTAHQGQQIYLQAQRCAGRTLRWSLLGPNGDAVFKDTFLCLGSTAYGEGPFPLPRAGRYQLIVGGDGDTTGTYRVTIQSR
jgi:Caspase domain